MYSYNGKCKILNILIIMTKAEYIGVNKLFTGLQIKITLI